MSALRASAAPIVLVLVVLVTAWIGRVHEGRKALEASEAASKRGDHVEAIVQARAAAEARCPWCASPELGYARLYALAKGAEARGDDALAVAAWRAVRAATLATTVLDVAPARRERAEDEIARLEHRVAVRASADGAAPAAAEERLREALRASVVPSAAVFLLLALGGALLLRGAVRLARAPALRALDVALAVGGAAVAGAGVLFF